jgi:hypothetical protein
MEILHDEENVREETIRDLEKALAEGMTGSGYGLVKCLDNMGWYIPSHCADELVEELGTADSIQRELHTEVLLKWVSWHNIKPQLPIGAIVKVKRRDQEHAGEIIRIDTQRAEYVVCIPALGHVKEGLGPQGIVLTFEEVEADATQSVAA